MSCSYVIDSSYYLCKIYHQACVKCGNPYELPPDVLCEKCPTERVKVPKGKVVVDDDLKLKK